MIHMGTLIMSLLFYNDNNKNYPWQQHVSIVTVHIIMHKLTLY